MAKFNIIKEYLKSLNISSPRTPEILLIGESINNAMSININTKVSGNANCFYDVAVEVVVTLCNGVENVFEVVVDYASIVTLNMDETATDEEKQHLLMTEVPQTLYPIMRDLISQVTNRAGFAVQLPHFDFEENYTANCEHRLATPENKLQHTLTYESVVAGFSKSEEGENFIHTCVNSGLNPYLKFEETPMYKYLLRFIEIVDYNHADELETMVDSSFYDALFLMLVMAEKSSYKFEMINDSLELIVNCGEIKNMAVSNLNIHELESLMTSVILDCWVKYNMPLTYMFPDDDQEDADEYLDDLNFWGMIKLNEFMNLYNNHSATPFLSTMVVTEWYGRLQLVDLATLKYRY